MRRGIPGPLWPLIAVMLLECVIILLIWPASREPLPAAGPTIEQIQQLTELVTQRVEVSDVVETGIRGRTGGVKAALIVHGDVLVTVDLQQARIVSRDDTSRTLLLELPAPMATSPRVDHQRTKIYQITSTGLWLLVPTNDAAAAVTDRAFGQAQDAVAHAGADAKALEKARSHAEEVIAAFCRDVGWTVQIRWRGS
jgi:hypothetical protein